MILRKFLLGIFTCLLFAPAISSAHAQLWLAPAYPGRPALGPAKAKGAVIWSHGRSVDSEDSTAPTPPYMATLRDGGWDTFRFNRMRNSDTLANSARGLAEEADQPRGHRDGKQRHEYGACETCELPQQRPLEDHAILCARGI